MMIVARKTLRPGCDNTHDNSPANSTGQWNLRHRVVREFQYSSIHQRTSLESESARSAKVSVSRARKTQGDVAKADNDGAYAAVTYFSVRAYLGHGSPLCWCSREASLNMEQKLSWDAATVCPAKWKPVRKVSTHQQPPTPQPAPGREAKNKKTGTLNGRVEHGCGFPPILLATLGKPSRPSSPMQYCTIITSYGDHNRYAAPSCSGGNVSHTGRTWSEREGTSLCACGAAKVQGRS